MPKHMIDISGWNTAFKASPAEAFKSCAAAGIDHVYIKATEGRSSSSERLGLLSEAARKYSFEVGAYHFARPDLRAGDAVAEAKFYLDCIKGVPLTLSPVLDIETVKDWEGNSSQLVQWCMDWASCVADATGRHPVIYTGPGFWASHLGRTDKLSGMRLWVAAYPAKLPASDAKPPKLGDWSPTAWQYTGKGEVAGLNGVIDLSYVYGDLS